MAVHLTLPLLRKGLKLAAQYTLNDSDYAKFKKVYDATGALALMSMFDIDPDKIAKVLGVDPDTVIDFIDFID